MGDVQVILIQNSGNEVELIELVDGSMWPAGDCHAQRAAKEGISRQEAKERNRYDYGQRMYMYAASRGFKQSSWP